MSNFEKNPFTVKTDFLKIGQKFEKWPTKPAWRATTSLPLDIDLTIGPILVWSSRCSVISSIFLRFLYFSLFDKKFPHSQRPLMLSHAPDASIIHCIMWAWAFSHTKKREKIKEKTKKREKNEFWDFFRFERYFRSGVIGSEYASTIESIFEWFLFFDRKIYLNFYMWLS